MPAPISARTERRRRREARDDLDEAGRAGDAAITSRPISPPIQTAPAAMWIQSTGMARPRGEVWPRVAGDRRGEDGRRRREERAGEGEQGARGAARPLRAVEPDRNRAGKGEQEEAELQVEVAAAEHASRA